MQKIEGDLMYKQAREIPRGLENVHTGTAFLRQESYTNCDRSSIVLGALGDLCIQITILVLK